MKSSVVIRSNVSRGKKFSFAFSLLSFLLLSATPARAIPGFLERFNRDAFSRPELRNQCSTCHVDPAGGGPRNEFGQAFDTAEFQFTSELRSAWPDRFLPSVSSEPVATIAGPMRVIFFASGEQTILEIDGEAYRLDATTATLVKLDPVELASIADSPFSTTESDGDPVLVPELPQRNQPSFGHHLVNLPTTRGYEPGELGMRFTHRFIQPVLRTGENNDCPDCAGVTDLFGFDSFSYSAFGGEIGITSRLAASIYRTPLDRTYEFGAAFQLLRQQGRKPLAATARISLETRRLFDLSTLDFERFQTINLVFPVSRSIANRAELFVVPMFSFRANPFPADPSLFVAEGETRRHQGTVGIGGSFRFLPRSAIVAEWTPRVAGYRPTDSRNAFSIGIQRTTNAHIFELVLTNTLGTTTSQAASTGTSDFTLGFNLYRRLR
jgi:hypothetical protein